MVWKHTTYHVTKFDICHTRLKQKNKKYIHKQPSIGPKILARGEEK